jgi:hypothetical protein
MNITRFAADFIFGNILAPKVLVKKGLTGSPVYSIIENVG